MEDEKILQLYWQRQEAAIEETQLKYGAYCMRIAEGILPTAEDAQECVSDTYMAAWNAIPPERPQRLSAYLGKLTRHLAIDRWRYLNREKRGAGVVNLALEELAECIPGASDPESEVEARQLATAISDFLRKLPALQRKAFVLRYFHLCTMETLCRECGISLSAGKSMLHRVRKKLQAFLWEEGYL